MKNKRIIGIVIAMALLLMIPFTAMQFTNEVNWNASDFTIAAVLLLFTGLTCDFVWRKITETKYRVMICGALLLVLAIIWIELAVGVFGTPLAGS